MEGAPAKPEALVRIGRVTGLLAGEVGIWDRRRNPSRVCLEKSNTKGRMGAAASSTQFTTEDHFLEWMLMRDERGLVCMVWDSNGRHRNDQLSRCWKGVKGE